MELLNISFRLVNYDIKLKILRLVLVKCIFLSFRDPLGNSKGKCFTACCWQVWPPSSASPDNVWREIIQGSRLHEVSRLVKKVAAGNDANFTMPLHTVTQPSPAQPSPAKALSLAFQGEEIDIVSSVVHIQTRNEQVEPLQRRDLQDLPT